MISSQTPEFLAILMVVMIISLGHFINYFKYRFRGFSYEFISIPERFNWPADVNR